MAAKDEQQDTQYVGEQPTEQQPGQDPDEANPQQRDDEGNFTSKGKPTTGVQPLEDDDIPETGR